MHCERNETIPRVVSGSGLDIVVVRGETNLLPIVLRVLCESGHDDGIHPAGLLVDVDTEKSDCWSTTASHAYPFHWLNRPQQRRANRGWTLPNWFGDAHIYAIDGNKLSRSLSRESSQRTATEVEQELAAPKTESVSERGGRPSEEEQGHSLGIGLA